MQRIVELAGLPPNALTAEIVQALKDYLYQDITPAFEAEFTDELGDRLAASRETGNRPLHEEEEEDDLEDSEDEEDVPEVGFNVSQMPTRNAQAFKADLLRHPNWKLNFRAVMRRIKEYSPDSKFYGNPPTKSEINMRALQKALVYQTIQSMDIKEVISKIEDSRGRASFITILYQETLEKIQRILLGLESIVVEGEELLGWEAVRDFVARSRTAKQGLPDKKTFFNKAHSLIKTSVGEGVGALFLQKQFGISEGEADEIVNGKGIVEHPFGVTAFPDFIIDLSKVGPITRQRISRFVGVPDLEYILLDTKTTLRTKSSGNERLQYPLAGTVNAHLESMGLPPLFVYTNPADNPNREYTLPGDKFPEFIGVFTNSDFMRLKAGKPTKNKKTMNTKLAQKVFSSPKAVIVYQDVGIDAGIAPTYQLTKATPNNDYTIYQVSPNTYNIIGQKGRVATLNQYKGQEQDEILKAFKITLPDGRETNVHAETQAYRKAMKATQIPESQWESHPELGQYPSLSAAVRALLPIEQWAFMFTWGPAGLEIVHPSREALHKDVDNFIKETKYFLTRKDTNDEK